MRVAPNLPNDDRVDAPPAPPARGSRTRIVFGAIAIVFLLLVVFAGWYLSSDRFRERVRLIVVDQLELATGGRVELKSLGWNLSRLEVEITDLTIHGLEDPSEIPYAHVDRLYARLKIISLVSRAVGVRQLTVERPVIHIIVYPDGTTNQPEPKIKKEKQSDPIQQLFDLAIERAEVRDGLLILNQRRIPLDLNADDLAAAMTYAQADRRYDGSISVGKIDTKMQDMRPFATQAEVQFSIFPDRAQIKALKLSTGRTRMEASGSMVNFKEPRFDLAYNVSLDLAEVGSIARLRELRSGTLDVNGQGNYSLQGFASNGKMTLKNASYQDATVNLRNVAAGLDFSLNQDRLDIPHLFMNALGGTVTGQARIEHWMATPPDIAKTRGEKTPPQQVGVANLKLTGLPISSVTEALSSKSLPLDKLKAQGTAAGTVGINWRGTAKNLVANVDLAVTPPAPQPGILPVTATVRGSFNLGNSTVLLDQLALSTPASSLRASGTLAERGDLRFAVQTSNLGEFAPVIDAVRPAGPMPVEIGGTASFTGTASGRLTTPSVVGHLEVRDFTTVLPKPTPTKPATAQPAAPQRGALVPAAQQPPPAQSVQTQRIHWDLLSADLMYSPRQASINNGLLRRGKTEITMSGNTQLLKGKFTDNSVFSARANMSGADVAELQTIAGVNYPVAGRLDLNLQAGGTKNNLHGNGRIALTNATAYGQPIRSLTSDVVFQNQEAQLRNIWLNSEIGQVRGAAAYNTRNSAFRFDLHGTDFRLEKVPQANRPNLRTSGLVAFDATGSGTPQAPVINASFRLRQLVVNRQPIGDLDADAVTQGADLRLTARSNFRNAALNLDGNVHLRGDMPGRLTLNVNSPDLTPLIVAFSPARFKGTAALAARLDAQGPFKNLKAVTADLQIDTLKATVENINVQNSGPVRVHVENQIATVQQFRIEGEGNRFLQLSGTAELGGTQRLNMRAEGNINLKLLQTFNPAIMSSGYTAFNVAVYGTVKQPRPRGQVTIENASVAYIDAPNGLSDMNGTLTFDQDRLLVQRLTARTGGGLMNVGGYISYDREIAFNLTATGRDIRIRYPQGISSSANANLTFAGTMKNSLLSGDITVTRFGLNQQFDFALYLARSKQPPSTPNPESPLNNVHLDIHVVSTPELQVQTSLAKVSGNVDLRVRGTATQPAVLGRVSIIEGDVSFNGTTYHLERGDIRFVNPSRIEPVLDIAASAHVRDYDITLIFQGDVNKLSTKYRSDPPLPEPDIIALLALGRTREESANPAMMNNSQPEATFTESASNALLGQALNATVSSRVQKIFGVSRIKIDPQVGGADNNANARMTVEQQISNKITITYITNLTQSAQQIVQFEYNINRNLSVIAIRDQNGVFGFDVRLRQRKK